MSNSYVMSTGGLECALSHGNKAVISLVIAICGWYSIKTAYQKDIHGGGGISTPTSIWRRGRDSNPRSLAGNTLSRRAR